MRSSALICWCSRFCATAGTAAASTASASVDRRRFMCMPSLNTLLRRDDEVPPSILGPGIFAVAHVKRELLSVTYCTDPIRRYTQRRQIGLHRDRASLAERQVVLSRSPLVAVSLDGDSPRRKFLEHPGVGLRDHPTGLVEFGAVEREEHWLERRVAVEVVQRLVGDRLVGQRLSDRRFVL